MAPTQNNSTVAASAGFKSLFAKKPAKPEVCETPKAAAKVGSPVSEAKRVAKVDSPAPEPKRQKLDTADTATAGSSTVSAEKPPMPLGDGTGPISYWTMPPGEDKSALSSSGFDPSLRSSEFVAGKPIGFALLSGALSDIEKLKGSGQGSRKKQTVVLSNLFRSLIYFTPKDLVAAIYFVSNKTGPDYCSSELGIGDATIIGAMAETFGRSQAQIKSALIAGEARDLGEVALQSRASQKMLGNPPKLTIAQVFGEMKAIANATGKDCGKLKKDKIKKMMVSSRSEEAKYIVRMLQSKMRIGINTPTILEALACAFVMTTVGRNGDGPVGDVRKLAKPPSLAELDGQLQSMQDAVRQAFCEVPNFDLVIQALFDGHDGRTLASACHLTLGIPVKPMLAKPSKGIPELIERLAGKRFTGEWKYDGERAQIHIMDRNNIRVYSRNSEDMTEKYPDVIQVVKDALTDDVQSGIVDSEVVAYDVVNNRILPFQILSTRGRKNIVVEDIKVQVCIMPFDCMFYNGESYVSKDLETRRARLKTMLKHNEGKVMYAVGRDFNELNEEEIQAFLDESIAGSCEGLMLKTLNDNASYAPSKRSLNWLKLKKDYIDGMGDSLDVVPIGAFYGKGKRHGSYGAFLLAVYDPENEEFQTVCKAGTGFSDEDLKTHYEFFKNHSISGPESNYNVDAKMKPDVWLEACQVWEIKAADLSISPVHTSAFGVKADGKGIGLRFPRFLRIRDDKQPEDATAADQIVDMFEAQATISGTGGGEDEDF